MTNSSRYNESLAYEAFISGKQGNRKYYISLSKTYGATPAGSLKIPHITKSKYIFILCPRSLLSVCVFCASDSAKINCYERAQAKGDTFDNF